jgi:hypothetical protein
MAPQLPDGWSAKINTVALSKVLQGTMQRILAAFTVPPPYNPTKVAHSDAPFPSAAQNPNLKRLTDAHETKLTSVCLEI